MSQTSDHPHGQQVVHVRGDSESDLEDLFKVLTYKEPAQVPLKDRNLPASFFRPPEPRLNPNHSREGSTDSSKYGPTSGLQILHGRSHSSPAGLPHTLTAPPPIQPHHAKTQSFDGLAEDSNPLPPGWEMAKTPSGQAYFLNHLEQITTWQDPRKSLSTSTINQPPAPSATQGQLQQSQQSPNLSLHNVGALPHHWEQATTPEGEIYFINHMDRTTSWFDPRIPKHLQKPGMKMHQLQQIQQQAGLGSPGSVSPPGVPSPACSDIGSPQSHVQGQSINNPEQQFRQQLRRLQQEKELLRKRQEEIARQVCLNEMLLSEMVTQPNPATTQSGDMQSVTTSGVDPFLGQGGTTTDPQHPRQNSADSGLGGMGTNYSLPRTPEDFLSTNIDEMDNQDGGHKMQTQQSALESMQVTATNMDVGTVGDVNENATAMDSDDLVPSLQEDISSELLTDADVQSVLNQNKMENLLTWL